jgi:hypothetical protein
MIISSETSVTAHVFLHVICHKVVSFCECFRILLSSGQFRVQKSLCLLEKPLEMAAMCFTRIKNLLYFNNPRYINS